MRHRIRQPRDAPKPADAPVVRQIRFRFCMQTPTHPLRDGNGRDREVIDRITQEKG